jgi:sugar O-acyltransferase (sialic acid O-acetyltransferase NeuD family)
MKSVIVLGAGGFSREARDWTEQMGGYRVEAFLDEAPKTTELDGLPVISQWQDLKKFDLFVLGVGDPAVRAKFLKLGADHGSHPLTVIHPSVILGQRVEIGAGSVICPKTVITTNIKIGLGVVINLTCTVGHDCVIGNYVTVSPGVNISGGCVIGENTYLGTNATLREYTKFPANSVLGMGAALVKTAEVEGVYVGSPAKLKL